MKVRDEVCGMEIEASDAESTLEYRGKTYHFCGDWCRNAFEKDPSRYAAGTGHDEPSHDHDSHGHHHH